MKTRSLLKGKTGNLFIQLFRYFVSGGIAFAIDFLLLYLLTDKLHIYYLLSAMIAFSVGLLITYVLSISWIFNKLRLRNRWTELLIFIGIGLTGLLLTYLFMRYFTDSLQLHYLLSKILTTIIVFFWNFVMKRVVLFSGRGERGR